MFQKRTTSPITQGIFIGTDRIASAQIECANDKITLVNFQSKLLQPELDLGEQLKAKFRALNSKELCSRISLGEAHYQIIPTERPPVPDTELRDALRFAIADNLNYPAAEAQLEYFFLPPTSKGDARHLQVIAARESLLSGISNACEQTDLNLQSIEVRELSLRNLARLLPQSKRPTATLFALSKFPILHIYINDLVYLTRTIRLAEASEPLGFDVGMESAFIDFNSNEQNQQFGLDIQRSFDFFESQYRQGPVAELRLLLAKESDFALFKDIGSDLGISIQPYLIADLIDGANDLPADNATATLTSIGAALRRN